MESANDTFPGVPVEVAQGAVLRTGVVVPPPGAPDDAVETLAQGVYQAFKQCPGQYVDEGPTNFWWVQIAAGDVTGWVSAINVLAGADNQPVPDVPQAPCVNV